MKKYFFCFLVVFLSVRTGFGQQISWEYENLYPSISDVKISPEGIVYVITKAGLYSSADNGLSWNTLSDINQFSKIFIDSNGNLYCYDKFGSGILRSSDKGNNFSIMNEDNYFIGIVEGNDKLFAGAKNGQIFMSQDGGNNFISKKNFGGDITGIYFIPGGFGTSSSEGSLLMGDGGGNIYHSENSGSNRSMYVDANSADLLKGPAINTFCLINSAELFVGGKLCRNGQQTGCFRTTNSGTNWTMPKTGLESQSITSFCYDGQKLYASEGKNENKGWATGGLFEFDFTSSQWVRVYGFPILNTNCMVMHPGTGKMFAGTDQGLYVSENGTDWELCNIPARGYGQSYIKSYYVSQQYGIFIVTDDALLRKTTQDSEWEVSAITDDAKLLSVIILDNGAMIGGGFGKIYKSEDMGTYWMPLSAPFDDMSISRIRKNSKGYLYATSDSENLFGEQNSTRIIRSKNQGSQWQEIYLNPDYRWGTDIHIDEEDNLYIILGPNEGIAKSTDDGDNWTVINNGLITNPDSGKVTATFTHFAQNSLGHIFVASHEGIFRTTNKGDSWERAITSRKRHMAINSLDALLSVDDGEFQMGISPQLCYSGLYENSDFIVYDSGLDEKFLTTVSPGDCSVKFIFCYDDYLYISNGVSLLVSTEQVIEIINDCEETDIQEEFSLLNNYPNPFNPSTNILFTLPKSGFTKLAVYNSLGEEVAVIVNNYLSAGKYSYKFDGRTLTSGVYLYSLISGESIKTRKMLLLK